MQIIVANDFAHINGGAAKIALTSSIGLARKGHKVTLLSAVAPQMSELAASGVKVICLGQHEILCDPNRLRAAVQGIWNFTAARAMAETLRGCPIDDTVVHVHGWTKGLSSSVVSAAVRRGFRVICTLHDYFVACPNGGFFNYRRNEICRLEPMSLKCVVEDCDVRSYSHKLWRLVRHGVQVTIGHIPSGVNHYIAVSELSREVLLPYLPPGATVFRVENPVDAEPAEKADPAKNDSYAFVGRLSPEKGPAALARAAVRLGARAVFIGDGPCRSEILSVYPGALVTGWLPTLEVRRLLKASRALVLPSLWYETLGLVVREAAAMGIPSVVPDTSAAREVVMNGQTGVHFKGGDEEDLLLKLRALQDNEMVRRLGQAAYESYWTRPITLEDHVAQLEAAYREMLETT
jgi:glycosyltransferase involved in cell wall biosynthesis